MNGRQTYHGLGSRRGSQEVLSVIQSLFRTEPMLTYTNSKDLYMAHRGVMSELNDGPNTFRLTLSNIFEGSSLASLDNTTVGLAASALGSIMPESYTGQNLARADSIICADRLAASLEQLKVSLFALSNNLINDFKEANITTSFARAFIPTLKRLQEHFNVSMAEPTVVALLGKCFQAACTLPDLDLIRQFLELGVNPNQTVWEEEMIWGWGSRFHARKPIQMASRENDIEIARLLIVHGADVNGTVPRNGVPALCIALLCKHMSMARLLLDSGASLNYRLNRRIMGTDGDDILDVTDVPVNHLPDIRDWSPLSIIVAWFHKGSSKLDNSHIEFLYEALDKAAREAVSASPHRDHMNDLIRTAVATCDPVYFSDVIHALLQSGGSLNAESGSGILPISLASHVGTDRVSTLLSWGSWPAASSASRFYRERPAALHLAALNGCPATVESLLEAGADVNHYATFKHGDYSINFQVIRRTSAHINVKHRFSKGCLWKYHSPLQFALVAPDLHEGQPMRRSKAQVARLLLSYGAMLFGREMVDAVELGDIGLVRLLHYRGACLEELSVHGLSPLRQAIRCGFNHIAKFLIDVGAKTERLDIMTAIVAESPDELLEYLKMNQAASNRAGDAMDSRDGLAAAFATENECVITKALLHFPDDYGPSTLCAAIKALSFPRVKSHLTHLLEQFLKRTPSVTSGKLDNTAIALAVFCENTEVVRILLQKFTAVGTQICRLPFESLETMLKCTDQFLSLNDIDCLPWRDTTPECSPLVGAIYCGSEEMLAKLLRHGFRPDRAAVLFAVSEERPEMLITLLDHGGDPDQQYPEFDTPLQMAVRLNLHDVVRELLSRGANVNAPPPLAPWGDENLEPLTALQHAVTFKNSDLFHLLIGAGADVNAPAARDSGATALQLAAAKGYLGFAKLLIEYGADINANGAMISGRTAIEIAAEHGRLDMVQFFLGNVPGVLTEGDHARQYIHAVGFAERNGHMAVAMVLRNVRDWYPEDLLLYDEFWRSRREDEDDGSTDDELGAPTEEEERSTDAEGRDSTGGDETDGETGFSENEENEALILKYTWVNDLKEQDRWENSSEWI